MLDLEIPDGYWIEILDLNNNEETCLFNWCWNERRKWYSHIP
jgi:hypothetical protein